MTPGRKFSATTSAPSMSLSAIALPLGDSKSSATLRLLRFVHMCTMPCPSCQISPLLQWRCQAPSGVSTAITSAPRSATAWMPIGPSRKSLKLTTPIPFRSASIGSLPSLPLIPAPACAGGELQRESTASRGRADVATQRGCALLRLLEIVEKMQVVGCNHSFDLGSRRERQIRIDARNPDLAVAEPNGEKLLVAELLGDHDGAFEGDLIVVTGAPSRICCGRMPTQTDRPTREPRSGKRAVASLNCNPG